MKRILTCVALISILTCCEEEWSDEAEMSYVVEITEIGDGHCAYGFATKPGGTKKKSISFPCGTYKIGEGIFTTQD